MQVLRENHVPVASSCGGDAVCAKCVVHVLSGGINLTTMKPEEKECLARHGIYEPNRRLSCQCTVVGNIKIDTNYW